MEVQCEYSKDQNVYKCTVTAISIVKPNTVIKSFKGSMENLTVTHSMVNGYYVDQYGNRVSVAQGPAITAANITWLHMEKKKVKFFPRNIGKTFPSLTRLSINSCGLSSISRNDLEGLWSLTHLDLNRNKLTMLPDDLFADMRKLNSVYINNNRLRFVSSKLLRPIETTLTIADFTNNVSIDESFDIHVAGKNDLKGFLASFDENCQPPGTKGNQKSARLEHLQENFEKFRISSKFSDFTIKICEKDFDVHKCVLAAQSTVFEKMFAKDSAKLEQPFVNVKSFSDKAFESFLNYFYTGRVDSGISPIEMIQLASEFDVPDLRIMCIEKILDNLSEINALEIFNLGHDHESDELIQMAFKCIKKVFPHIDDDLVNDRKGLNRVIDIGENVESWD